MGVVVCCSNGSLASISVPPILSSVHYIVFEIIVNLLCSIMQILWLSCCLDAMVGDVNLFLTETDCAEESAGPTTSAEVEVMIAGE